MKNCCARLLSVAVAACFLAPLPGQTPGGAKKEDKKEFGLDVGQKMPFHVVDFATGSFRQGCPSVMISNAKTRGIEVWSRTGDEKAFALASQFEGPLEKNRKAQGYLVFYMPPDKLADLAKKHDLQYMVVGKARTGSWQKMPAIAAGDVVVFFLNEKLITARWVLKSKDLDQATTKKIAEAAAKFLE